MTTDTQTVTETFGPSATPIIDDMRHEIAWLAKNLEDHAEGDVNDYIVNSSRSSLLKLLGATAELQVLESLASYERQKCAAAAKEARQ